LSIGRRIQSAFPAKSGNATDEDGGDAQALHVPDVALEIITQQWPVHSEKRLLPISLPHGYLQMQIEKGVFQQDGK
ncbi:hypothetical protein EJB05_45826, partial [Eragrostis curvula]